jgi:hypothetical protein
MRTMERSEKCSRKSWGFRRETIAFDSAFKEIELVANCKFSERQTFATPAVDLQSTMRQSQTYKSSGPAVIVV